MGIMPDGNVGIGTCHRDTGTARFFTLEWMSGDRTRRRSPHMRLQSATARNTGPHPHIPDRTLCAILTRCFIRERSAPDQHQRRLPPRRRPAGRPRGDRHRLDLCRPGGGAPLWQETQTVAVDGQGRYSLLLGASQPDGIPAAVFGAGDARWRGTLVERAGEVEGARVRITSVPYALRASDADTLGDGRRRRTCWRPPPGTAVAAASRPPAVTWKRQPRTSCWPARRISSPNT